MIYIIICLILIIFVSIILFFRFRKNYDLKTKKGVRVKLSSKSKKIPINDFENWTNFLISFWSKKWEKNKIEKVISKVKVFIYDEKYIVYSDRKLNGAAYPEKYKIEITTLNKDNIFDYNRVKSLFYHEMSHVIVEKAGGFFAFEKDHHKLFKEMKLGA